jgi:hypothetical protein
MKKAFLTIFILSLVSLMSCVKEEQFSNVPAITYDAFFPESKSSGFGILRFKYTDGDADLGYENESRPINNYDIYFEVYNLGPGGAKTRAYVETTVNGVIRLDSIIENYLPYVDLSGKQKAIQGDITYRANFNIDNSDSIKVKFHIFDRARNKSNELETPTLIFK